MELASVHIALNYDVHLGKKLVFWCSVKCIFFFHEFFFQNLFTRFYQILLSLTAHTELMVSLMAVGCRSDEPRSLSID